MTPSEYVKEGRAWGTPDAELIDKAKSAGLKRKSVGEYIRRNPASSATSKPESSGIGGIPLNGQNVLVKKPQESTRELIMSLPKNRAYPVGDLSERWGISESTIREKAGRIGCKRYVERTQGDWVLCVMHPDTAKQHGGEQ